MWVASGGSHHHEYSSTSARIFVLITNVHETLRQGNAAAAAAAAAAAGDDGFDDLFGDGFEELTDGEETETGEKAEQEVHAKVFFFFPSFVSFPTDVKSLSLGWKTA